MNTADMAELVRLDAAGTRATQAITLALATGQTPNQKDIDYLVKIATRKDELRTKKDD
jgi:hypothetical protein